MITMNKNYCKVLIISNAVPNEDNATSITLMNMFSGWPQTQLAVIHTSLDKSVDECIYPVFKLSELKYLNNDRTSSGALLNNIRSSKSEVKGVHGATSDSSVKSRILNYVHTLGSSYKALLPYKYSNELNKFISDFSPDVIYSPLGSVAIMDIVHKISEKFHIPVVPHFMDDWPHTVYEDDFWLLFPRLKKGKLLKKIFERTKVGIVISEKMAGEYRAEYRKVFVPLMNCVDYRELNSSTDVQPTSKKIIFSYFGGLHLLRWQILKIFFQSLINQSGEFQNRLECRIYTSEADRNKYKHEFDNLQEVVFCQRVSQNALLAEMIKSSYLIHVEAFDDKIKKYTRLSISTKIPDYLLAQKPIIAIGPDDSASIEYLRDNNCAHVISDLKDLHDSLLFKKILTGKNNLIVQNALQLFLRNHDKKNQHQILRSILLSQAE